MATRTAKQLNVKRNAAFTLVELSIVLVIIGLLVGGVLAGQSLIRSAELRAISSEFMKYTAAENNFRDKYFAIPGDMGNASSFWASIPGGGCASPLVMSATCGNGNGDGLISLTSGASKPAEMFEFWNELALAGIIEGSYTGTANSGGATDDLPGTNSPKSKVNNAGWSVTNMANSGVVGGTVFYAYDYGNVFVFGSTVAGSITTGGVLTPQEAWNIDTKLDDGKPVSGKVIAVNFAAAGPVAGCTTTAAGGVPNGGTLAAPATTDLYNLTSTNTYCALAFAKPF